MLNEMAFSGKVVIVTGAASGIGASTAELFIQEKAAVVLVDKDGERLGSVVDRCQKNTHEVLSITADVSDDKEAKRIIEETMEKFNKLDVLVNCAGIMKYGSILDGNLMSSFDGLVNVNLRSVMLMTTVAAPHLIESKGNIVNVASVGGLRAVKEFMAYCVTKAGVTHFTRGAAFELAPHGVRVNSVSPAVVRTNIAVNAGVENQWEMFEAGTPLKRILEPEEIANLIVYLASEKAKGITGSDFVADNGCLLI